MRRMLLRASRVEGSGLFGAILIAFSFALFGILLEAWVRVDFVARSLLALFAFAMLGFGGLMGFPQFAQMARQVRAKQRDHRREIGCCARCGYLLDGVKGNFCPECGYVDLRPRVIARPRTTGAQRPREPGGGSEIGNVKTGG